MRSQSRGAPVLDQRKTGSGKSTLFKFIVSPTETTVLLDPSQADQRKLVLSHYLWRAGSEMQQSIKVLLCSSIGFRVTPAALNSLGPDRLATAQYRTAQKCYKVSSTHIQDVLQ
ncbi:hypothetical protein B0H67DRAFT_306332 [Lasiosphaeris hirsuta]|uniref:Uncharacterized protein n=1 Tax=Lasiosphaeris hirsuta TaxID=260670 RepID=A0AA40AA67_9PEZI|nr:hypothetical protein B0H67DRAFT_306332 [Lasiosphaeris hirsuta]